MSHEKIIDVKCGYNHTICLTDYGSVYSWGYGKDGVLGHGNNENISLPSKIKYFEENKIKIKKINSGMNYCLVLSDNGTAFSWGKNEYGQLGLGTKTQQSKVNIPQPLKVGNLEIEYIFSGEDHSALITKNKEVYLWGFGLDGRLGNKMKMNLNSPSKLILEKKSSDFKKVACGGHHTAFLTNSGDLYICGNGRDGEMGNGENLQSSSVSISEPILVIHFKLTNEKVVDIACGSSHSIALVEKYN